MNEMEDTTVLYMEIAKDAIGQRILDYSLEIGLFTVST